MIGGKVLGFYNLWGTQFLEFETVYGCVAAAAVGKIGTVAGEAGCCP